jgi:phospholipid/cholesterol/gamma-HCH transport system ATP-binding protein
VGIDPIIQVVGLTAGYGDAPPILTDLSVDFLRGRVTAVVGTSGCGKTTLFKCIVGLLKPQSGRILVAGRDLSTLEEAELPAALSRVGLLFQQGAMLNSTTVADNVTLPMREHTDLPAEVMDEMVRLKLQSVGLAHAAQKFPSELSGGMRKRAALARAMALDPELLLCDEPSAGLDPRTAADLDDLILRLKETFRMTVVVVTHELASIDTIADDVVFLGRGGVLHYAGPLAGARACPIPEVRDFFARRAVGAPAGTRSLLEVLKGDPMEPEARA